MPTHLADADLTSTWVTIIALSDDCVLQVLGLEAFPSKANGVFLFLTHCLSGLVTREQFLAWRLEGIFGAGEEEG